MRQQIMHWFYNQVALKRNRENNARDTGGDIEARMLSFGDLPKPGRLLAPSRSLKKTLKSTKPIRSHRTELQVYIKEYYQSKLKHRVESAMEEEGADHTQRLRLLLDIARDLYDGESDDVKEGVRARVEDLRKMDSAGNARLGEWTESDDVELLKT